jgi:hypothetical protein
LGIKFHRSEHNARDILICAKSTWTGGMRLSMFLNDPALNCCNTIFIPCPVDSIPHPCPVIWDEPDIQGSFEQYYCCCKFFKHVTAFPARIFHNHTNDGQG